jgi:hypothetical protein
MITKINEETGLEFSQRQEFVTKYIDKLKENEYDPISKVWANMKFRNCKYSKPIYLKIKALDKTL